ncbi:hypothetical protein GCM10011375_38380 [Hymenobacter qilianensis]|uniref:Uncharacterized protein n=2 Tax=Hymenobacter qilianensis TaxID=1385715 RepID=A0ACB5PWR1_9BACT|nr:hypothetical protein [Hymenobacter qilianensis]QNP54242.1 hypothetical protein H9L05_21435 [Hymenobacter qilianensis]GGF79660.1 hypothetical protein GCM10011375_38380 [Hymenobacter qilianensis]
MVRHGRNCLRKITPAGLVTALAGQLGPGLQDGNLSIAQFRSLQGIALDAQGTLVVADAGNHTIRQINPE